jgi:hypothetical protein
MNWEYFPIIDEDGKARQYVFKCLSIGAADRSLSRGLLSRYESVLGNVFLIADDSIALDRVEAYGPSAWYADPAYNGLFGLFPNSPQSFPIDGLVAFVDNYVHACKHRVALFENRYQDRSNPYIPHKRSRFAFHQQEVYHVVVQEDVDRQFIRESIEEADNRWSIGCCASGIVIPANLEFSAELIDEIVDRTEHIIASAFDDEGYLVWSPVPLKNSI